MALGAAVALLGVAAVVAWDYFGPPSVRERAAAVQDSLRGLRAGVDSCRMAVTSEEAGFRRYDERVQELRERVRAYEGLDPRGVPQDSFEVYMDVFERYNEAVPRWKARAESLQAHSERCRRRTQAHNELADSLRTLLVELGEVDDAGEGGP